MTHLLDTCILVHLIRVKSEKVRERFHDFSTGELVVSAITEAELRCGADKSQDPAKNHRKLNQMFLTLPVMAFDRPAAVEYGKIRAGQERAGKMIGPFDFLIAAHAIALGLVVVTSNAGEFERVPGLTVEDWTR